MCRWVKVLMVLGVLILTVVPASASADGPPLTGGVPSPVPVEEHSKVTVWYFVTSLGAEFGIRNNEEYVMDVQVELWVFSSPYPANTQEPPERTYFTQFKLGGGETVVATLEGWDLEPGEYWIPARFSCTPGPSGLAGADPILIYPLKKVSFSALPPSNSCTIGVCESDGRCRIVGSSSCIGEDCQPMGCEQSECSSNADCPVKGVAPPIELPSPADS